MKNLKVDQLSNQMHQSIKKPKKKHTPKKELNIQKVLNKNKSRGNFRNSPSNLLFFVENSRDKDNKIRFLAANMKNWHNEYLDLIRENIIIISFHNKDQLMVNEFKNIKNTNAKLMQHENNFLEMVKEYLALSPDNKEKLMIEYCGNSLLYDNFCKHFDFATVSTNHQNFHQNKLFFYANIIKIIYFEIGQKILQEFIDNYENLLNLPQYINNNDENIYKKIVISFSQSNKIYIPTRPKSKNELETINKNLKQFIDNKENYLQFFERLYQNNLNFLINKKKSPINLEYGSVLYIREHEHVHSIINLKFGVNKERFLCLYHSPQYVAILHEIIHVLRASQGETVKFLDAPKSTINTIFPEINFLYNNLEEFLTIWNTGKHSENKFLENLNLPSRIGHGCLRIDVNSQEITDNVKKHYTREMKKIINNSHVYNLKNIFFQDSDYIEKINMR